MNYIWSFLLITLFALGLIPFLRLKGKAIVLFSAISSIATLSSILAYQVLVGEDFSIILEGSIITGDIDLKIDALSAWFILLINFGFVAGCFYGLFYMKAYKEQVKDLSLQAVLFMLLYASLLSLCVIQNSLVFLVAWEIMALSAFLSVIFEHGKSATLKGGINYLIQSHISILFLMIGFIWVASQTGSYSFNSIYDYSATHHGAFSLILFLFFFVGFAIKAGFVPFHTWLPEAHPVAPSHISGIMSGILIKIGIFGILRMILLIDVDYTTVGTIILIISVVSGIYGVMLAIIQHNLKRLLAYHSIENIGIIGIGIGMGCLGLGNNNLTLITLGFAGALLHTLNHSLFKSLLFYAAGNVYQATHSMDIEKMGGLIKKMPQTALLFLIGALAISGLPPFNGFISEFILYTGLFSSIHDASLAGLLSIIITVSGLVLIGGLALMCFTKAFGIVFLGTPRHEFHTEVKERPFIQLLPLYLIATLMISIGLFPGIFLDLLVKPVQQFTDLHQLPFNSFKNINTLAITSISQGMIYLILTVTIVFGIRRLVVRKRVNRISPTWGCGYTAATPKIQYTAGSFVKTYSKLFEVMFLIEKKEKEVKGIFPKKGKFETHPFDLIEKWLIDYPVFHFHRFLNLFNFFQNGKLQFYILYGITFILSVICIPLVYKEISTFIEFLKAL
jgi:hydrogenase-4 component B